MGLLTNHRIVIGAVIGFLLDPLERRSPANAQIRLATGGDGNLYAVFVDSDGNII